MSGETFTIVPNTVITLEPMYNNVETPTESMKKEYFNIDETGLQRFQLEFKVRTDTERDAILTHFNNQLGSFYSFPWTSVPDYVYGGSSMTGRWVKGSLQMPTNSNKWRVAITFEKDNSLTGEVVLKEDGIGAFKEDGTEWLKE